jgi:hypothetical protein
MTGQDPDKMAVAEEARQDWIHRLAEQQEIRRRPLGPWADLTGAREEHRPPRDDARRTYHDWQQLMCRLRQWDQTAIASALDAGCVRDQVSARGAISTE